MSYCLNPRCTSPQNADDTEVCQCGAKLQLGASEAPGAARYRALRPLGQGGFGRTFLAVGLAKPDKPLCVIKQFFPNVGIDRPKASELFREEAERLSQLSAHPQIPNLLDYLEQDGQQYLIQEFIEGQNLEQELRTQSALSESQIRQLLLDLLPVVQFMHDRQVIHRDIKPANIIRRASDQKLVLVDLGAAKYATGTALLRTGTTIGSAEYTAPEQVRGRAVFASDIYSLGATCVHLLTQMSPFDLFDTSDDRWVWRDYLIHPVSDSLAQVLDRMLQNATSRRYQFADQVLTDLRQPELAIATSTRKQEAYFLSGTARPLLTRHSLGLPRIAEDQSICTLSAVGEVVSIALSPDGKMLVSSSASRKAHDNAVNVWNLQTREMIHQFQQTAWMNAIAIRPDGRVLVGGGTNGTLNFWSLQTGELMGSIHAHAGQVSSLAICSAGDTLVTSGTDGMINLWNLTTGRLIRNLNAQSKRIPAIAISPDRQFLASSNYGATISLWEFGTGRKLQTLRGEATHGYSSIAISPNGRIIACGSSASKNGAIQTWDFVDRHLTGSASFDVHVGLVQAVAVSPDGKLLASGSRDMTVKLWNLHTGALVRHFQGHLSPIFSVAFSSNEFLVSGDGEGVIKVWALP
ncbi:serine/threonine protein kinase [Microcoleus sp. FACHB-1515]|uniref:serine/threonine-protein kinase n=1 Tax=Cyanophyceae TaxID=3028117 RepID=UPI001689CB2A|nr:serine/threonine-protein kinase [Microcoleus sp. FACHB-1515]MBD2092535.1 serine/threonine protein kinase [Microcoleus sp. FACHB-1515]